jgi:hypothetical protein
MLKQCFCNTISCVVSGEFRVQPNLQTNPEEAVQHADWLRLTDKQIGMLPIIIMLLSIYSTVLLYIYCTVLLSVKISFSLFGWVIDPPF